MRKVKFNKHKTMMIEVGSKGYLSCPLNNTFKTNGECYTFCVGFEIRDRGNKKEVWCNVFAIAIGELVNPTESEPDAAQE